MSTSNPIIPPGSPLQRTQSGNPKLLVSVSIVIAIHIVVLAGVLIQGCKRDDKSAADAALTNSLPPIGTTARSDAGLEATRPPDVAPVVPTPTTPAYTPPAEHRAPTNLASGDIPAPSEPVPQAKPAAAAGSDAALKPYVVKAGDNLTRIAKAHGTTPAAIRAANNLKTDRLLVNQKLKVPEGAPQ